MEEVYLKRNRNNNNNKWLNKNEYSRENGQEKGYRIGRAIDKRVTMFLG